MGWVKQWVKGVEGTVSCGLVGSVGVIWARVMDRERIEVGCVYVVTCFSGKIAKYRICAFVLPTLINHNFVSFDNLEKFTTINVLRVV